MPRTRDPDVDRRIHAATVALLQRDGLARMTVDAVAAHAGVGKAAVYRRYRSKRDLVIGAVDDLLAVPPPPDDLTGRPALGDVVEHLRRALVDGGGLGLLTTLLTAGGDDPELAGLWRRRVVRPRVRMLEHVLRTTGADAQQIGELALGGLVARHVTRGSVTPDDAGDLADALWLLATSTPSTTRRPTEDDDADPR